MTVEKPKATKKLKVEAEIAPKAAKAAKTPKVGSVFCCLVYCETSLCFLLLSVAFCRFPAAYSAAPKCFMLLSIAFCCLLSCFFAFYCFLLLPIISCAWCAF
jgi:hypothetical protein